MIAPGIIERAFELARDGSCVTLEDIRRQLAREGFANVGAHTSGFTIRQQLNRLLLKSPPQPVEPSPAADLLRGERRA